MRNKKFELCVNTRKKEKRKEMKEEEA